MRRVRGSIGVPSLVTVPAVGRISPAPTRSSVDLPQPDAPMSASTVPRSTQSDVSASA